MRIIIIVISLAAFALGAAFLAAAPGVKAGLWGFGDVYGLFQTATPAVLGAGVSALLGGIFLLLRGRGGIGLLSLAAGATALAGGSIPIRMKMLADANPFIHDITTDMENPPQIIAAASAPRENPPEYVGEQPEPTGDGRTIAEAQMAAFPDIAPRTYARDVVTTVDAARAAIEALKMEIIADGALNEADGAGWRVEAVFTSAGFGFKDDFIVRVRPDGEASVVVDVRSKSRVGISDLGANAARVRAFFEKLDAALA